MAQRTVLVDDIDETEGTDIETITFGLHGASYEVDLSKKNQKKLEDALAPFLGVARRAGKSESSQQKSRAASNRDYDPKVVRTWAAERDEYKDLVPAKGRIPLKVLDAWRAENN